MCVYGRGDGSGGGGGVGGRRGIGFIPMLPSLYCRKVSRESNGLNERRAESAQTK